LNIKSQKQKEDKKIEIEIMFLKMKVIMKILKKWWSKSTAIVPFDILLFILFLLVQF